MKIIAKKSYLFWGFLLVIFGWFVLGTKKLNNYDLAEIDFLAIKEKIEKEINLMATTTKDSSVTVNNNQPLDNSVVLLSVPFTVQAPEGQWQEQRFQDGCEETAVLMAIKWAKGETLSPAEAKTTILDMADWELQSYGSFTDTNAKDTAERLLRDYFSYAKYKVSSEVSAAKIIAQLHLGNLVLVPTNGQKLNNPHYKTPGPERHMLVIRGYDPATDEFITNDPGTKVGEGYRYKTEVLLAAAIDYPTGNHEPTVNSNKAMIIVSK